MTKTKLYTIYICPCGSLWVPYKVCIPDGVSGSYMRAVIKLVAHEELEIWTSLPHSFIKKALTAAHFQGSAMAAMGEWRDRLCYSKFISLDYAVHF